MLVLHEMSSDNTEASFVFDKLQRSLDAAGFSIDIGENGVLPISSKGGTKNSVSSPSSKSLIPIGFLRPQASATRDCQA